MRIELAGSITQLPPLVFKFDANYSWVLTDYITAGYTNFDAICIGGGGGKGGGTEGVDSEDSDYTVKSFGGEGGGGGFHRVQGLLSALVGTVEIVVGGSGSDGDDGDPDDTTDGEDGGYSSFYYPACAASGGKGGTKVLSRSRDLSSNANGGDGGIGAESTPGFGAEGGIAGLIDDPEAGGNVPGVNGVNGSFISNIGQGGGGGAGGIAAYLTSAGVNASSLVMAATNGGRGSYDLADLSVFGYGSVAGGDPDFDSRIIVPGMAGGARTTPLNGSNAVYGRSGQAGVVLVRLTVE